MLPLSDSRLPARLYLRAVSSLERGLGADHRPNAPTDEDELLCGSQFGINDSAGWQRRLRPF